MANLQNRQFDMLFETGECGFGMQSCSVLNDSGSSQIALMTEAREELILLRDCIGICLNSEGRPTRKTAIQWSQMPSKMLSDVPHLLGLLENGVEIQCLESRQGKPVQWIPLRNASAIAVHPDQSHAYAASHTEVLSLRGVPIREQVVLSILLVAYAQK